MIGLPLVLGLLKAVPAAVAMIPEFKKIFDDLVGNLKQPDQAVAKEAYQDLIADNAEGFARLDAKLAEAEKR